MDTRCPDAPLPGQSLLQTAPNPEKADSEARALLPRERRIQMASEDKMSQIKSQFRGAKPRAKGRARRKKKAKRRQEPTRKIAKIGVSEVGSPHRLMELKKCNSKDTLRRILLKLSPESKRMVRFYMTDCFIQDLFTRRLKNKGFLLSKRELLFRAIENPDVLAMDCHFDNNLLKNFCTGVANFILKHSPKIHQAIQLRINRKRRSYLP